MTDPNRSPLDTGRALHTPGPWRVRDHTTPHGGRHIWVEGGPEIGRTIAGPYCRQILEDEDYDEKRGDARLIAAAPDMLAALEGVLPADERDDDTLRPAWKAVAAAIAKARGGSQ